MDNSYDLPQGEENTSENVDNTEKAYSLNEFSESRDEEISHPAPKKKKSKLNEQLKLRITAICCLAAILICIIFSAVYLNALPKLMAGDRDITLTVIYQNGEEDTFQINTANTLLGDAIVDAGYAETDDHDSGNYKTINGISVQNGAVWEFAINGKPLSLTVNETPIKDGDKIVVTYVKAPANNTSSTAQ